jgi:hypothetical protein
VTAPAKEIADSGTYTVTEPGIYNLPADVYHGDPVPGGSLSSTGARKLLPPSCPAKFKQWRDEGEEPNNSFDFGRAAHREVLGDGGDIVVVEGDGKDPNAWRTANDKAAVQSAHDEGKTPIRPRDAARITAMADAIRAHRIAGALFRPGSGHAEQSLIWVDQATGVWRRAMLDWLPDDVSASGRLIIPDYKTADCIDDESIARSIYQYGYNAQGAWYIDAVKALITDKVAFVLVFQEKEPPYLVRVVEIDAPALRIGHARNRLAIHIYATCTADDHWPGYGEDIDLIALPRWAEVRDTEEYL